MRSPDGSILHVIGCHSVQYGTFEDNLVTLVGACARRGARVVLAYPEAPAEPRFVDDVRAAGGDVEVLRGSGTAGVEGAAATAAAIRRLQPRVVHAHFGRPGYVAVVAARTLGVPTVLLTKHHIMWQGLTRKHAAALRGLALLTDRVVCVSEAVRSEAIAARVPASKLVVLPFGVNAEKYARREAAREAVRGELGIAPDVPLVLCVNHLTRQKGIDVLFAAWRSVSARFPEAVLAIVGDGPIRGELEAAVRSGMSGIRLLGMRSDVPDLLSAADMFVCPALGEGGGLNVVEAVCAGVPTVSTRVSALEDRGWSDLYVRVEPQGDPAPLMEGLERLLADRGAASALGSRARSVLESEAGVEAAAENVAALYFRDSRSRRSEAIA